MRENLIQFLVISCRPKLFIAIINNKKIKCANNLCQSFVIGCGPKLSITISKKNITDESEHTGNKINVCIWQCSMACSNNNRDSKKHVLLRVVSCILTEKMRACSVNKNTVVPTAQTGSRPFLLENTALAPRNGHDESRDIYASVFDRMIHKQEPRRHRRIPMTLKSKTKWYQRSHGDGWR